MSTDRETRLAVIEHTIGKVQRDLEELRSDLAPRERSLATLWDDFYGAIDDLLNHAGMQRQTVLQQCALHLYGGNEE